MAKVLSMDMVESLEAFIDRSGRAAMPEAASELLELLEAEEVEPLDQPGRPVAAEDAADRLENRLERLKKRAEREPEGITLIEDAVASLRANDGVVVSPWTYEDGEGVRWYVLANDEDEEVIACYTSAAFVEADI